MWFAIGIMVVAGVALVLKSSAKDRKRIEENKSKTEGSRHFEGMSWDICSKLVLRDYNELTGWGLPPKKPDLSHIKAFGEYGWGSPPKRQEKLHHLSLYEIIAFNWGINQSETLDEWLLECLYKRGISESDINDELIEQEKKKQFFQNCEDFNFNEFYKLGIPIEQITFEHLDRFWIKHDERALPPSNDYYITNLIKLVLFPNFHLLRVSNKPAIDALVEKYNLPTESELTEYKTSLYNRKTDPFSEKVCPFVYKTLYDVIEQLVHRDVHKAGYAYGGHDSNEIIQEYNKIQQVQKKHPYLSNDPTKK